MIHCPKCGEDWSEVAAIRAATKERDATIATLRAALDGLTAEDLWLGVEISAIGILTFAEPMVSVAGARAAIRAHLATMNEAGNG